MSKPQPIRSVLRNLVTKVEGASNMPDKVNVMNKKDAETLEIADIFKMIGRDTGLHVRRGGYNALKDRFREVGLKNHMVEEDKATGYYTISEWRNDEIDVSIRVDYRVPLYVNSRGFQVNGNRLSISA